MARRLTAQRRFHGKGLSAVSAGVNRTWPSSRVTGQTKLYYLESEDAVGMSAPLEQNHFGESQTLLSRAKSANMKKNPCKLYVQDLIYKGQLTSKANKETRTCTTPGCTLMHIGHHPRRAGATDFLLFQSHHISYVNTNFIFAEYCSFAQLFFPNIKWFRLVKLYE